MREGSGSGSIDGGELWLMMWLLLIIDVMHMLDLQQSLDFRISGRISRAISEQ